MKKLSVVLLLAACVPDSYDRDPNQYASHIMESSSMFENGCLKADIAADYVAEMPCLDTNSDGCVSPAEWEAFMDYWRVATPEPEIPLCVQMRA